MSSIHILSYLAMRASPPCFCTPGELLKSSIHVNKFKQDKHTFKKFNSVCTNSNFLVFFHWFADQISLKVLCKF